MAEVLHPMNPAFVWSEHWAEIIVTSLLSMVPMFEGRYALTIMMGMGMPALYAFLLAAICSSVPVPFILWLLRPVLNWFYALPIAPLQRFAAWLERYSEKKSRTMNSVGLLGLFLFVAIPLPGTGGWTGSLIATMFNMDRAKSLGVIIAGNFAACLIMTLLTTGVLSLF